MAQEVDRDTFFHTRESGGTMISSAYKLCDKIIDEEYPPEQWNIYPFHFSDGDNWSGDDTDRCIELLKSESLPKVNLFGYGQVESPYGSGQFIGTARTTSSTKTSWSPRESRTRTTSISRSRTSWERASSHADLAPQADA